ncbi:hypothetical protein J2Z83_003242 [Virgibacillus natechei]|uniref:Holin n=1 Tax=Virgibacillus natechei TaxID=1216297 RepID=A0ABS4IJI4_9BACI|nr:holin [Virgibacillus natechei]MBP1971103.1 hypothetical protein [Virgibacillus natechei]UZD12210.1 holin [Virgibacillus natechei]
MNEILMLATLAAPVTNALIQAVKMAVVINKRFTPLMAAVIGVGLGAAAFFVDAGIVERMWAGGISGLASVGLFELGKYPTERIDNE